MTDSGAVFFRVQTKDVHYINRIFEGYEYLGVVSTVNRDKGLLVVRATPDTKQDAIKVLQNLPIEVQLVDKAELE
jgi:hypothetical protein